MKLKDDTSVRVDEAASFLRKQLAMNAGEMGVKDLHMIQNAC